MNKNRKLTLAAMFLAIGQVLPFITGQIPQIGVMLSPMHFPVLLCGMACGWQYGGLVGFICPLLRGVLFGMPALFPNGTAMAFELMTYGCVTGLGNLCQRNVVLGQLFQRNVLFGDVVGVIIVTAATIPLVEFDSRLGYEPSMEYMTDVWHIEWKIRQVTQVLENELPGFVEVLKKQLAEQ